MAQISTDIETKTDTNLINAKGSGMGVYTEAGIKYILQNGFNIGYYMRHRYLTETLLLFLNLIIMKIFLILKKENGEELQLD